MLDFINPEEFDYSWLPEEELQVPDSIASKDLQTAIDCFCEEVSDFLVSQCPENASQIRYALMPGRSFHSIYTKITSPKHIFSFIFSLCKSIHIVM